MKKLDLGTFGKNLSRCIKSFNETNDVKFVELYEKVFSDYNLIYHYISGDKTPSIDSIILIANILNVSLEELLS